MKLIYLALSPIGLKITAIIIETFMTAGIGLIIQLKRSQNNSRIGRDAKFQGYLKNLKKWAQ